MSVFGEVALFECGRGGVRLVARTTSAPVVAQVRALLAGDAAAKIAAPDRARSRSKAGPKRGGEPR